MFGNIFKGKTIIVTGNTGFKGSWLSLWLYYLGAKVIGISKDIPTNPSLFEELNLSEKSQHHFENICDAPKMKEIFSRVQPDFVFHLAAQPIVSISYEDPLETFQTNTIGTANILEALRSVKKACHAVIITSDKCYDNVEWIWGYREQDALGGKDPYSASKGAAELVIKTYFHSFFNTPESNVKLCTGRAGNVIGGGDWALNRIVPDCFRSWKNNQAVKIRNPNSTRPWQHVLEPLSGYLRAAQALAEQKTNIHGEPFNIGPNADQNHTVLELLRAVSKFWQSGSDVDQFAVEANNAFHEAGLLKLNCDKALAFLQWKPVLDFYSTAQMTGEWYNYYYNNRSVSSVSDFTLKQIEAYALIAKTKSIAWAV